MAEGFVIEATMAVLTTLLARVAEEVKLPWSFKDDKKEVEIKLKRIHMLLCGASNKRFDNPLVDDWLSKVKKVAYDADDLLDELAYEALKQRLKFENQSQFRKKLRFLFSLDGNPIVFNFQMGHRMRHLMGSIEDVFKDAQVLGIKPVDLTGGPNTSVAVPEEVQLHVQRELVGGRGLIGRDEDEANIISMLCDPENVDSDLTVVGIFGMGGLGKTALSKRAFDRIEVRSHFEKRIWGCVSHDFNLKGILEKMVELVDEEASTRSSYQATIAKLEKNLSGKRYILVLDDVWDTLLSVWESFRSILLDIGGSKGTTVLATSRSSRVIATMHSEVQAVTGTSRPLIYQLKGLDSFDSWSLFQQRVHHIKDVNRAKRMVAKCGGIPLAINVLGDLLRQRCLEEWKQIEESELWKSEDKNGILPSLRLSFNYLPSAAVKNCFVYCAIFPQDAIMHREHLIQLWMAQGFLQPCEKMEHIGNEYFNILLSNSFFDEVAYDEYGMVIWCKMHDIVHALAKAVARQEYLTLSENVNMTEISSDVRHLSLRTEKTLPRNLKVKLHTLISNSLHIGNPINLLIHAKCLRVLSLVDACLFQLPDSIRCLKHLRYLDISKNDIMEVSSSVGELYYLQTLRYYCSKIQDWSSYPTLPKELDKLVNLRYICTNGYSCSNISLCIRLANPRTLQKFDKHKKWGVRISDIGSMDNITGSLAIWCLEHISSKEEVRKASLRTKANIDHLDLSWSYNATCFTPPEEVLEEMMPHENLKVLKIWYYNGEALPRWLIERRPSRVSQLCNLVEMKFYYCHNLKQLPASLIFPSLKVLVVWGCDNLTSFPHLDTMDSLEILQIGRCPTLAVLPNLDPLINISRLEIHNCSQITSLPLGLASLRNLTELEIGPLSRELDFFPFPYISDSSPLTQSLQKLSLIGWSKVGSLPNQLRHFTQLQTLTLGHFSSLKALPNWLGNLTCLQVVDLQHMENLICLPSRDDMLGATKFHGFRIKPVQCPKLGIVHAYFDDSFLIRSYSAYEDFNLRHVPLPTDINACYPLAKSLQSSNTAVARMAKCTETAWWLSQ
ncbi:putative disease resistance protein RGA1, partial [Bienertia sinuspersici]